MTEKTCEVKLSVVVPFYNETSFLDTAVQSILSQGIEAIEVLIVNDNPECFEEDFFESYNFPDVVRVIHHPHNKGLPSSRNSGVAASRGDFIAFLDADDYYLPSGLSNHLAYAEMMGADITHAQTVITHVNQTSGYVIGPDSAFFNKARRGRYEKEDVMRAGFFIESSWSSIYRTTFLLEQKVKFDESQIKFEDRIFVIEALTKASSLAIMGEPCRVWRKRNNSITTSSKSHSDQLLKLNLFKKSIDIWLEQGGPSARHFAAQEIVRQINYMITKNESSPWYGCFGFSSSEEDQALSDAISEVLASFEMQKEELILAYNVNSPRYTEDATGGGKICPADLYEVIISISEKNYERAREIILRTVNRTDGYVAPYLVKNQSGLRILLHFGLHKTGSTHIQYQLSENREALRAKGVLFPQTGLGFPRGKEPVRPNGLPGHQELVTSIFQNDESLLRQLHGEVLGAACHTVIISAENLSQPDASIATRTRRVRRVVEALETIGRVTPVIMYRRPDAWLESYYRELAGNGAPVAYQTPGEFLVNSSRILDFAGIVESIEVACGSQATLLSFDDLVSTDRDLVFEFLSGCGIEIQADQFSLKENTKYGSTCNAQLELARMVSLFVKDQETRQNILRAFYSQVSSTEQNSRLFSTRERKEIVDKFCDSADQLFAERGIKPSRAKWMEKALQGGEPEKVQVPADFIEKMWISGVMNGTNISPAPLVSGGDGDVHHDHPIAQISERQLKLALSDARLLSEMKREISYMRGSVSWKVTKPLRLVMHQYKLLRGRG